MDTLSASLDLTFRNINFTVNTFFKNEKKKILKNLNGHFKSGQMTALMGSSGSGKTTLLNIIAGYKSKGMTGEVLISGAPRDLRRFRKQACYIMQENALMPHLTVQESMEAAASLKLGTRHSQRQRQVIIDGILSSLGLVECRDRFTPNLSGGQRKRLSIAQELVSNPPIMFFDEPTSGLDSSSCYYCIRILQRLALEGRTVVCSVHQPSARIMEMFDHLYFLAAGQCIYEGPVSQLVPHLSEAGFRCPTYHNPADYVMELSVGDHGDVVPTLVSKLAFKNLLLHRTCKTDKKSVKLKTYNDKILYPNSSWTNFYLLLRRSFLCSSRNMIVTHLTIGAMLVSAACVGLTCRNIGLNADIYIHYNIGIFTFSLILLMFCAMMPAIVSFPLEQAVFEREHLNSWYSLRSYYFAKTVADTPLQIFCAVTFLSIVYLSTSQPLEVFRFSMFLLVGTLLALNAQSIGHLIGTSVDIKAGVPLGPTLSVSLALLSGSFIKYREMPRLFYWLSYLSYFRHGLEGLMVVVYGYDRKWINCTTDTYCHFSPPEKFLAEFDMQESRVSVCIGALTALLFVKKCFIYLFLTYKTKGLQ